MTNDNETLGRVLTRREVIALMGVSGAALFARGIPRLHAHAALPACVVRPQQTEGPYFSDVMLHRSDIRAEPGTGVARAGTPFDLTFNVSRVDDGECRPLAGAQVDVWQCDANGVYSDARDRSFNTIGQKFLRGYQRTDTQGRARFTTIYPGWYQGRTVHVHFKIRTEPGGARGYEFTSQLYFDDAFTDRVYAKAPYAGHAGRRTRNEADGIFRNGGRQLLLDIAESGDRYSAVFDVGLQIG